MSGTTTQAELSTYNRSKDKPLSSLIAELLQKRGGRWQGTASDLRSALHVNLTPRTLSQKLNQLQSGLEKYGIVVTRIRRSDRRLLVLSYARTQHSNETTLRHAIHTASQDNDADLDRTSDVHLEEPITFPFKWDYGTITELSKSEKEEMNQLQHQGGKHYQKPCSLCGEEGHIEFCKTSQGCARVYLCRPCAEDYVRKALQLMPKIKTGGSHMSFEVPPPK